MRRSQKLPRTLRSLVLLSFVFLSAICSSGQSWESALAQMALTKKGPLERETVIPVCLESFRSNATVKALLFLPSVSDDFYLINRGKPRLAIPAVTLSEALIALTNATQIKVSYRTGFLLVHTASDKLDPQIIVKNRVTAERLMISRSTQQFECVDLHWDPLQPKLQTTFHMAIRPKAGSQTAWHFARHNLAAFGLTDAELIAVLSMAGKTKVAIERNALSFTERLAARH